MIDERTAFFHKIENQNSALRTVLNRKSPGGRYVTDLGYEQTIIALLWKLDLL